MTPKNSDKFLFLANHPGLDFINTRLEGRRGRIELLTSPRDLLEWCHRAYLLETRDFVHAERDWLSHPAMAQALRDGIRLREALELAVAAICAGSDEPDLLADAIAVVNSYLAVPAIASRLSIEADHRLVEYPVSPDGLIPLIARQSSGIFTQLERRLIKKCRSHECILYFYDTSKNRARAWCSMDLCGNRAKAAKHYQKESGG